MGRGIKIIVAHVFPNNRWQGSCIVMVRISVSYFEIYFQYLNRYYWMPKIFNKSYYLNRL